MSEHSLVGHSSTASDRTGLLIIRASIEEGSSEPLRAYMRISDDVSQGFRRELTLARPELVCAEVGQWLEEMLGDARPAHGPGRRGA